MNLNITNKDVLFPIGVVARMYKISVATLRLYEQEGLIIPQKTIGRHRQYSTNDLKRLECIRRLIEEKGLNIAGIRMMLSAIPCWEIKPCSEADRNNCDAYISSTSPCWMVERKGPKCQFENCRDCSVYIKTSSCDNIKEIYKTFWRSE